MKFNLFNMYEKQVIVFTIENIWIAQGMISIN